MTYSGNPTRDVAAIFDPVMDAARRELAAIAAEREANRLASVRHHRELMRAADTLAMALGEVG